MAPITMELFPAARRHAMDAAAIVGYKTPKPVYKNLFKLWRTGKVSFAEYAEFGELELLHQKEVGAAVDTTVPEEAWSGRWFFTVWALGLEFPEETLEDDALGICAKYIKRLGAIVPKTIEHYAAQVFNSGDATTYHSTPEGKALFANNHKLVPTGPATYDTLLTPAVLSAASLQSALTQIDTRKDEYGQPVDENVKRIVYHPQERFKVAELLKSTHSPEDDQRHINAINTEFNIEAQMWKNLATAGNWFLQCDEHGLCFLLRAAARTGTGMDPASGNKMFRIRGRWAFGIKHPRGMLGAIN